MRPRQSSSAPSDRPVPAVKPPRTPEIEFLRLFRVRSAATISLGGALLLVALGQVPAAGGVLVGLLLFLLNALLLYGATRALFRGASRGGLYALAGLSGLGRISLLAVAVGLVCLWDRAAGLGTCLGLLLAQGNLRLGYIGRKGRARWLNT